MAAKQGLSAQISQASEDAKRAVLSRTSLQTSLWFSNLNTTCTIKSAPPRTPEVLSLLSTKSGWLFKRNEQHVWQTRWCCVVPHTFMYYFDANVLPGEAQPPLPPQSLQEDWNNAVANGHPHRGKKQSAPRSSLYFMGNSNTMGHNADGTVASLSSPDACSPTAAVHHAPTADLGGTGTSTEAFATMQPAGIIDLECYTCVHRSQQNQLVLELAGDDSVNPDLRQFYFTAGSENETEAWTQALLGQRHTALMDEIDAYKQVCDGFAQQLQILHTNLDNAKKQAEDAEEELYQVRSEIEDGRRQCWKMVEDVLDRNQKQQQQQQSLDGSANTDSTTAGIPTTSSFRADLNVIRSQDMSLLAPVQLLGDYTRVLEDSCLEMQTKNAALQEKVSSAQDSDHDRVQRLEEELQEVKAEFEQQKSHWTHAKQVLTHNLTKSQKELEDLNKDLASTRMEITMYQSSTRNKITELQNHKKILKKEVLDLRQKLEDTHSELGLVKHKEQSHRLEVGQERKKAELLERYLDKMESQVKVQQNMMEMMSASGVGSIHGGQSHYEINVPSTVHSPRSSSSYQPVSSSRHEFMVHTPSVHHNSSGDVNDNDEVENLRKEAGFDDSDDDDDADANAADIQMTSMSASGTNRAGNGNTAEMQIVEGLPHHRQLPSPLLRRSMVDDDNKSHMSELTEDRTQKQFDALHYLRERGELRDRDLSGGTPGNSGRMMRYASGNTPSPQGRTPPAYIVGGDKQLLQNLQNPDSSKLDTIHSSAATSATTPNRSAGLPEHLPRYGISRQNQPGQDIAENLNYHSSSRSLGSGASGRLSVAQRARLQAERGSTPVRIRLDDEQQKQLLKSTSPSHDSRCERKQQGPPVTSPGRKRGVDRRPSNSSRSTSGGFFSNIGRKLEAAIDKSVLGVPGSDEESGSDDDDELSSYGSTDRDPADPVNDFDAGPSHNRIDRSNRREYSSLSGKPALLTRETLNGHDATHRQDRPLKQEHGESSVVSAPTRKKLISPVNSFRSFTRRSIGGNSGGDYESAVSSVMSDEKKTATTPDRNRVGSSFLVFW